MSNLNMVSQHFQKGVFFILSFAFLVFSKSAAEWKKRTIYQILTDRFSRDEKGGSCDNLHDYCGGTFKGILNNLDYINNMGFNAIWISPILANSEGGYHGYWFTNLYKINPHFGIENDLLELINECHKRDIYVMLDIVLNHVGNVDMDFNKITPFNHPEHYHDKCQIKDWNNQHEVEYCRLCNLPDLNQENDWVRDQLTNWLKDMINHFDFDGFRLDTTCELSQWFLTHIRNNIGDDAFITGEVLNSNINYVATYANLLGSTLSYPLFFALKDVFGYKHSAWKIHDVLKSYSEKIHDPEQLGVFMDNHDQSRFLNYQKSWVLYKNALTFTLFSGISILYYGTEQAMSGGEDPNNREFIGGKFDTQSEFYKFVRNLLLFKNEHIEEMVKERQVERHVNDNVYCFSRGKVMICTCNYGDHSGKKLVNSKYHPYADKERVCNILTGNCVSVENNILNFEFDDGYPIVFYPNSTVSK